MDAAVVIPQPQPQPQPKPPRRISDAPSARNLKPRHVSAVRRWPSGCGRSRSPPPPQPSLPLCSSPVSLTTTTATATSTSTNTLLPNSPHSNTTVPHDHANQPPHPPPLSLSEGKIDILPAPIAQSLGNNFKQEAVQGPNGNLLAQREEGNDKEKEKGDYLSNKRWMNSKVYPPPKRRAVSAIRRYPLGCGRDPHFCLGLINPPLETDTTSHKINHQENEDENENENQNKHDKMSPEIGVLVEEDENRPSLEGDHADREIEANGQSSANDDSKLKVQDFIVVEKAESMGNFEIGKPNPGECVTDEKPKCEVVSMDEDLLVNGAAAEPGIVLGLAVQKPKSEGLCENIKKIKEKKKPVKTSDIKKPNSEQDTTSNDDRPDAEIGVNIDSQPSKEIVVYSEIMPRMDKSICSRGKEKVVFKNKVLVKNNASPKLGGRCDDSTMSSNKDTRLVPFHLCNDEDAAMDPCTSEAIVLSQIRPGACAKKSAARPSKPCLADRKTKKKGSRVAKKTTQLVKVDSPSSQQPNLMTLTLPPVTPFDGERLSNARGKVKKILRLFQMVCRVLLQKEESGSGKQPDKDETGSLSKPKASNRIDLKAADIVKRSNEYVESGNPIVGHLPGVEVGDEFRYRMELHLIGLHRPLQSGIDWTKLNGIPVATSIVASGGYSDGMDGSDVLMYTGSGGKPTGKKGQKTKPEDQKLERGNLALKNSMDMKTPVRVIHGLNTSDTSKVVMTFTYDGLYMVEEFNQEPEKHKIDGQEYTTKVFRYKLKRMPGQPELGLHVATKSKKSKVREGLCVADISQGKEKIPICAINTIDDEKPPTFKYITSIIYPSWYEKTPPKGCDCTGKCSSLKKCSCALKNGGEIAFNFNGAIIQAKPLIYECGPSCRCPSSCHNRVSQNGIKIPLEIFKTEGRGWGVRSLSSIPSGSFICEYVGELLRDEEAERRGNDEYLFDIGHNYDDAALWEGLPSFVPGIRSMSAEDSGANTSEGFTIDAVEMGNVGRFINHSCSPNLYAQNLLFDHDDKRMPHIMFFAAENIPPLQELTYHYNYTIGEVRDLQGNEKVKRCHCGSSDCEGRLY